MTKDDIVKNDLIKEIRTFTEADDHDYDEYFFNLKHPGMLPWGKTYGKKVELSDWNKSQLEIYFNKVSSKAKAILEIGVCRNEDKSSTWTFINNKNPDACYFGVDIEDKSFLDDESNNVFTMKTSSSNINEIMSFVRSKGVEKFDFIFIDGWHSINQVLDDWRFTQFLNDGGIVGLHDTNCHPGPMLFVDNLDTNKFNVDKKCTTWLVDYGISFVSRK